MTRTRPEPLPQVMEIAPYVPGHAPRSSGGGRTFKLASNENPLGSSQAAREAVVRSVSAMEVYPDGGSTKLREAIGARYGLDPARLICGAGSDEIFQLLGRAFLGRGDNIVQTTHAFLVYRLVAQQSGAGCIDAPETELTADVDAILACVNERTKIVFLANPNNPTGTYLPADEVRRLHAGLPDDVLLVLDGAYAEYVVRNDYVAGIELASEFENVLMTRTFSKIYGLAALRLGWAYGPPQVIDALNRVRGPFNVSTPAMLAGIAALEDRDFVEHSVIHNTRELTRLSDGLKAMGLTVYDSVANFVLARFADAAQARDAAEHLETVGVSVRGMTAYKLPDCLRISVGETEGVDAALAGLKAFLNR